MGTAALEKIPITVGVVGHLDAITTPEHKKQIELLFKDLAAEYPNSPVYCFHRLQKEQTDLLPIFF